MRKLLIILAALLGLATLALWEGSAGATIDPDTNQVSYWCPGGHGIKYDPASTPFVVPSPPAGFTWTLLVLKAGSEQSANPVNETFSNPVVGQAYSRTDGKDISHAILCKAYTGTTTTTQYQTTTTQGSTTTQPTTTTTIPVTTTLCEECSTTTTAGTTTTQATTTVPQTTTTQGTTTSTTVGTTTTVRDCCEQTTTTASTTTTVASTTAPTTTVAPTTTAAAVTTQAPSTTVTLTELPHTGASSTWVLTALGSLLMLAGWGLLKVKGLGA